MKINYKTFVLDTIILKIACETIATSLLLSTGEYLLDRPGSSTTQRIGPGYTCVLLSLGLSPTLPFNSQLPTTKTEMSLKKLESATCNYRILVHPWKLYSNQKIHLLRWWKYFFGLLFWLKRKRSACHQMIVMQSKSQREKVKSSGNHYNNFQNFRFWIVSVMSLISILHFEHLR